MAYEIPTEKLSLIAGEDLTTKQYHAVKVNANGNVVLARAGENAIGILQNKPEQGKVAEVMSLGISKAVYGGTVTAGQNLAVDSEGRLVNASGNSAVIGVALESGEANEIHSVLLVTRVSAGANTNSILSIPIKLAKITTSGDVVSNFVPGFAGAIKKVAFVVTDPVTTAGKSISLNLEIGTTDVSGGVVSLTSANTGTLGAVINGTAITGNNVFGPTDSISVEATVTQAFAEGEGVLLIVLG